jgi:hypothetical protein
MSTRALDEVNRIIGRNTSEGFFYRTATVSAAILFVVLFILGFWPAFRSIG